MGNGWFRLVYKLHRYQPQLHLTLCHAPQLAILVVSALLRQLLLERAHSVHVLDSTWRAWL
jgi:hypothetical protein